MVTCIGIPCTINTAIANSDRTTSNPCVTGTGSDCIFTCEAGFHVQGLHTCSADRTLSGGSCERNACTGGLTLPNSPTTCAGVFGDECRYTCDPTMSATTMHACGADGDFSGGSCVPCSGVLEEMLGWLETSSAVHTYCPTADVTEYQGVLTVRSGKELFVDGSGGSTGSVAFNGFFCGPRGVRATSVTLINTQTFSTSAWATGSNVEGQLGLGDTTSRSSLEQVAAIGSSVVQVAAGAGFSAALTVDGEVYLWGRNTFGQIGDNTRTDRPTPTHVTSLGTDTVHLALGQEHALALKQTGKVFSWGYDGLVGTCGYCNLGVGESVHRTSPTEIVDLGTDNAYIVALLFGGMVIKSDGRLFNWGANWDNQLGHSELVRTTTSPTQLVLAGSDNTHVVSGHGHTLLLKDDGSVVSWGWNRYGQIGNGECSDVSCSPQGSNQVCFLALR